MRKLVLKRLWDYLGKYKIYLIGICTCAVLSNIFLLLGPIFIGKSIDSMIGAGKVDFNQLKRLLIILLFFYILSIFFQWVMTISNSKLANKTIRDIRQDAFNKLSILPLRYYDTTPHGDIISKLTNDVDLVSEGLLQGVTQIISAFVIVVGTIMFMLFISPIITIIVVIITPLCFYLAYFIAKRSNQMFKAVSVTTGELNGYIEEMIGNQKIVKAFNYEERSLDQFMDINRKLYICGQKAQYYSSLTNPTTRLVNNIAYVFITVIGSIISINTGLSIGKIASFLTYSNQFAKPINEITSIFSQFQSAITSAQRIFSLIDEKEEEFKKLEDLRNCDGCVEFKDVSFNYTKDIKLINNFNLKIDKGQTVAIVGPTGSGKTTLVNLLMRFYDIDSGHIIIDSRDIYDVDKDSLRKTFGMVLQESWLFKGTVLQNISYGRMDASDEEVIECAKVAHAHEFITKLSDGYHTMIDENGQNLSQGQKQLLTIARVMLLHPSMLILDEATSSIDTRTEIRIQKAFTVMMKDRTSFIIAHRLSTIKEADVILVLCDGDIIEQGTHEKLLNKKGFYYNLYNNQFSNIT